MVNKLKTLNSIYNKTCDGCIAYNDLQDAAREWIKHAENQVKLFEQDDNYDREQINFWLGYRMAIIDFFNLEV